MAQPWSNNPVFPLIIITAGSGFTGLFVYSGAPAKGKLITSIAAQNGTDPYGNAYFQGLATYAPDGGAPAASRVVDLLSTATATLGFFQYNNPSAGAQGALILAVAAVAGNDPVTAHSYVAGLNGIDPVFGDVLQGIGSNLQFGLATFTRFADIGIQQGAGATNPYMKVDAPEQTTAQHMEMLLQGDSPDGTSPAQLLIGRVSGNTVLVPEANSMVEVQDSTGKGGLQVRGELAAPTVALIAAAAKASGDQCMSTTVKGDAFQRHVVDSGGIHKWGSGAAATDTSLQRGGANLLQVLTADFDIATIGRGLRVAEGTNARMGVATLVAGTVTVANTTVTVSTRVILSRDVTGGTPGHLSRTISAGVSFTINSSSATDTSRVVWLLLEPG